MSGEHSQQDLTAKLFDDADEIGRWLAFHSLGHAKQNLEAVCLSLRQSLKRLLQMRDRRNAYWEKSIELGIRSYGMVLTRLFPERSQAAEPEEFRQLLLLLLSTDHESIVSYALTAMFEDAPVHSFDLLPKLYLYRSEKTGSQGFRLTSYLDRCIGILEDTQNKTVSS